jgi:hypothetical protein
MTNHRLIFHYQTTNQKITFELHTVEHALVSLQVSSQSMFGLSLLPLVLIHKPFSRRLESNLAYAVPTKACPCFDTIVNDYVNEHHTNTTTSEPLEQTSTNNQQMRSGRQRSRIDRRCEIDADNARTFDRMCLQQLTIEPHFNTLDLIRSACRHTGR